MASDYRGLYLIGDKKTGRITDVQVEDDGGQRHVPGAGTLTQRHGRLIKTEMQRVEWPRSR
jgi:hypothetical protein